MKILVNVLAVMFLGWPALVVGYLATAIKNGYLAGAHLFAAHESAALEKFVYRVKVETKVPNASVQAAPRSGVEPGTES